MNKINEVIDPGSIFGRVMLVFFWGGLAADIVTLVYAVFSPVNPVIVVVIAWTTVGVNMWLVYMKAILFKSFNRKEESK